MAAVSNRLCLCGASGKVAVASQPDDTLTEQVLVHGAEGTDFSDLPAAQGEATLPAAGTAVRGPGPPGRGVSLRPCSAHTVPSLALGGWGPSQNRSQVTA